METLISVLSMYKCIVVAFSGGKDSSVVASKTIEALIALKQTGKAVPSLLITSSDTGVENPEVHSHLIREHQKIIDYCELHGLIVETKIVQPSIAGSFIGRILLGQSLPVFANTKSRSCTDGWKIQPQQKFLKQYLKNKSLNKEDVLTLVGTRLDESTIRASNMKKVGTDTQEVAKNDDGFNVYAPIAFMTTDDVWLFIAEVVNKMRETYSDFEDLMRIYKDANGECVIVSDNTSKAKQGRACGARHGCWSCCAGGVGGNANNKGVDKSLTNMIDTVTEDGSRPYAYMKHLTNIQQFLVATQYDWNRRNWVGRSIHESNGEKFIKIVPDTYSGEMVLDIFRYMLTAQIIEAEESYRLGIEPRFELMGYSDIVYLDARWSECGLNRPFTAYQAWFDIVVKGERFFPEPDLFFERASLPRARYLKIEGLDTRLTHFELATDSHCDIEYDSSRVFAVDEESAEMALCTFTDKLSLDSKHYRYAYGMQFWTGLGVFTPSKGRINGITERMALTNCLEDMGVFSLSNEELYSQAIEMQIETKTKENVMEIPIEVVSIPTSLQLDLFSA